MTAKDSYGQHTNGNTVSDLTNRVTGNGDWASGNGTGTGEWGAGDQTTGPGGRSATIQGVHALDGIGRSNNDGNKSGARSENGHH